MSLITRCRGYSKKEYNNEIFFAESKIVSSMAIIPYTLALYSLKHEAANYPKIFLNTFLTTFIISCIKFKLNDKEINYSSIAKKDLYYSVSDIISESLIEERNFDYLISKCLFKSMFAAAAITAKLNLFPEQNGRNS